MNNVNLYDFITNHLPTDRNRQLLFVPDKKKTYSWADMERISAHFSSILATIGCKTGDRIAVQIEKSPEALFLYLACLRSYLVFLPISIAYRADEVDYIIADAVPSVIITDPAIAPVAEATAARYGVRHCFTLASDGTGSFSNLVPTISFPSQSCVQTDIAALLYTSGTTGRPKGAMISHHNLISNGETLKAYWSFTDNDLLLHALPMFHAHGLFVACHCVLLSGACMIWLPAFDSEQVIAQLPSATVFMGVPTYYTRLLANINLTAAICSHIRLFISGSAPLSPETFTAFQHRTGHTILERYGMTETGMNTSNPYHGIRRASNVGFPLPGVSIRVVGETNTPLARGQTGILQVYGDNVFMGYWRKKDQTSKCFTEDNWFITGDLAYLEEDGTVVLVGRSNDLIISGGCNVYPQEVERVIDTIDEVIESAVIGLPHPDFGEAVVAIVRRKINSLKAETIIEYSRQYLANYKVPKVVLFLEKLPSNILGKVKKDLLRERYRTLFTTTPTP